MTILTLETLRSFLQEYFSNPKLGDWNDIGFLLEQLDEIEIKDTMALRELLHAAQPGLKRYQDKLLQRLLGGTSPTGTVRMAMWMVSSKAAASCPAGRSTYRNYHKYVRGVLE